MRQRRVSGDDAAAAAQAASEAARVLQQRSQEKREAPVERSEPAVEPKANTEAPQELSRERIHELRQKNPTNLIREELAQAGLKRAGLEEPKEAPKEAAKPVEAKVEEKAPEPQPQPETQTEALQTPKLVKVKVDGEESEVEETVINEYGGVKGYQIAKAAENRLAKANKLVEEVRASQTNAQQQMQAWLAQQKQEPVAPQPSLKEMVASKLDTIRFGTPEEASAAFAEILAAQQPKQQDPNALVHQATLVIENQRAVAEFKKSNPDISSNPDLMAWAKTLEREALAKLPVNQPVDWKNFYDTIESKIRAVVPRKQSQLPATTQQAPSSTSPASEKEARKASITVLPSSAARAELPKEEKEPTRADILNEMRKSRGQPTH